MVIVWETIEEERAVAVAVEVAPDTGVSGMEVSSWILKSRSLRGYIPLQIDFANAMTVSASFAGHDSIAQS